VFLTGATGFLGKVVLHDLLRRREELGIERIHLAIRRTRRATPAQRLQSEVLASPCLAGLPPDALDLLCAVEVDLAQE
jgi:thioester reductase-like protein